MKRLAVLAICVLSATPALAISRYQTMSMSCAQVQDRVDRDGAAILRWTSKRNPGLPLYGRYVAHRGYCQMEEIAESAVVRARDTDRCPVLKCVRVDPTDDLWRMHRR